MLDLKVKNLADASEAGFTFELLYPGSQEKTGAFVTVRGAHSKTARAHARKKYTEYRQRELMNKRKNKDDEMTLDEAEDMAIETAIVRLIGWKGIAEDGKEIPFTKENAERVLREHSWIREQVVEESDQLLNFQS
jgi:hypothetical protein